MTRKNFFIHWGHLSGSASLEVVGRTGSKMIPFCSRRHVTLTSYGGAEYARKVARDLCCRTTEDAPGTMHGQGQPVKKAVYAE